MPVNKNAELNSILNDAELESVVNAAKESRENIPNDMEKIKDSTEVNENADIELESVEDYTAIAVDLFNADNEGAIEKAMDNKTTAFAKDSFNLTDDETIQLLETIKMMNNKKDYPVFDNLPKPMQDVINSLMAENQIPDKHKNAIARTVINEMLSDAGMQEAFVDLQKALDDALNIPSIADMYSEHTKEVMEVRIPEMAENIKDAEPEKAKLLMNVKEAFTKSYTFSFAREMYENNARIRKAVRRYDMEIKRALEEFNFRNSKSNFLMNDVREMPDILKHIFIEEPSEILAHMATIDDSIKNRIDSGDLAEAVKLAGIPNMEKIYDMDISETDIQKFCVMICKSCENMDPTNIVDASYMYYMMKNIIMLKHTQEAKTDFAAELISNICDTIAFIRNKEAEFYAANLDKSKPSKKLRSDNSRKQ